MSGPSLDDPRFDAWCDAIGRDRAERASASWFVIGHSGREGDPWKVYFESGDEAVARAFFSRRATGDGRYSKTYKSTVLTYGSAFHGETKAVHGMPFCNDELTDWRSKMRASQEREARDERRAQKEAKANRRRIATTEKPRVRIVLNQEPNEVLAEQEQLAEHEATTAMPLMRIAMIGD